MNRVERERERPSEAAEVDGARCQHEQRLALLAVSLLTFALLAGLPRETRAQCPEPDPEMAGQWSRPISNFGVLKESLVEPYFNGLEEIAHAIILPPPHDASDTALQARVIFIARSKCDTFSGEGGTANHAFLWDPAVPSTMTRMFVPTIGYQGTGDMFCAGHALDADGNLIVGGGLNYVVKCFTEDDCIQTGGANPEENSPVGHRLLYKLDTSVHPPIWVTDEDWPAFMQREHWYPTLSTDADGRLSIHGHQGAPKPDCPYPDWPYGSDPEIDRLREVFDSGTLSVSLSINETLAPSTLCSVTPGVLSMGIYPRLHLLSTGQRLFANASDRILVGGVPTFVPPTHLMNLRDPACPPSGLRWEPIGGAQKSAFTKGSSTVHYVLRDSASGTGLRDVVYVFGGIEGNEGDDDAPCEEPSGTTDEVWRFRVLSGDPGIAANVLAAGWSQVSSMCHARVNQNAVLTALGSTILIGGTNETCTAVTQTEEFFPSEVFGSGPADTGTGTLVLCDSQLHARTYHSVAFLLPDGRIVSAGGNAGTHTYHSIEVFSPWYYGSGARPQIEDWPRPAGPSAAPIEYDAIFDVDVTLAGGSGTSVDRVVLIRSGAVSHAFDMNQRYVELAIIEPSGSYPNVTLSLRGPRDGYAAPPGYYLLFAVDSNGLPSVGRWVRVAGES